MSIFKVGAKVRIQPAYVERWHPKLPERGHIVAYIGDKNALLDNDVAVPWERLAPDVDLPYDPKPPQKTLAEKELEVLQQDPIRRRWMELLGPQPQPNTEDFTAEHLLRARTVGEGLTIYEEVAAEEFRSSPPAPPQAHQSKARAATKFVPAGNFEFKAGDRVWDAMYASQPFRKGTVEKVFEGFGSYLVRWDDGGKSCRKLDTLKPESDPGKSITLPKLEYVDMTYNGLKRGDKITVPGLQDGPRRNAIIRTLSHIEGDFYSQYCSIDYEDGSSRSGPPGNVLAFAVRRGERVPTGEIEEKRETFKSGDRVRRTGAPFQAHGTISGLTDLWIEVQWDDGSKTVGAYAPSATSFFCEKVRE